MLGEVPSKLLPGHWTGTSSNLYFNSSTGKQTLKARYEPLWIKVATWYARVPHLKLQNKVDLQNNILHTLREASYVGGKAIFHISFPAPPSPPGAFLGSYISKKVFGAQINVN